jgi:hypothetical protein
MGIIPTVVDDEIVAFVVDDLSIPLVIGRSADGAELTAHDIARREQIQPEDCNHAGATYSSNLAFVCLRCRQPMFLPPRLLAYLPASTITAMQELWRAAGWPQWENQHWSIVPQHWTMTEHLLFDHCGGIPVRHDRQQQFQDALAELCV